MHGFEVHSNESACRKSGRLGLEQVQRTIKEKICDSPGNAKMYGIKVSKYDAWLIYINVYITFSPGGNKNKNLKEMDMTKIILH